MSPENLFILGVKRSKVKVTSHKNIGGVGLCILVSAGFFLFSVCLLTKYLLIRLYVSVYDASFSYTVDGLYVYSDSLLRSCR